LKPFNLQLYRTTMYFNWI